MNIADGLIELRILLNKLCDGFSEEDLSKNMSLSTKTKILFLLQDRDMSPSELIGFLCIAKSNLANITKSMIKEGFIENFRNMDNSKNVFYRITEQGKKSLKDYKEKMLVNISNNVEDATQLAVGLSNIIHILKGDNNDKII